MQEATGKKEILIVEDDNDTQTLLRKRLEHKGFECISTDTVEAALEILKNKSPDLVILDLGLPRINGTAFLTSMRQWLPKGRPVPPVIVLSGHNEKEIVDLVLDEGASGFLSKPVDPEILTSMISNYL